MQNNSSLHLKLPDPTTAYTFHRSFYCSLIHWSILQLFTDPSTIQPFFVHWSIAWSPTHSAYILINSLLSDESILGFLHDPSLELLPDPTHVTSIAPAVQRMQHPSRLYVIIDPSLYTELPSSRSPVSGWRCRCCGPIPPLLIHSLPPILPLLYIHSFIYSCIHSSKAMDQGARKGTMDEWQNDWMHRFRHPSLLRLLSSPSLNYWVTMKLK